MTDRVNVWQCAFCPAEKGVLEHQYGGMMRCAGCGRWTHVSQAWSPPIVFGERSDEREEAQA